MIIQLINNTNLSSALKLTVSEYLTPVSIVVIYLLLQTTPVFADTLLPAANPQCQPVELPTNRELADFEAMRAQFSMSNYEGKQIGNITIVTLPIFNEYDEKENNMVYRFINRIHSPTQHYVVKRQLLFSEGEQLQTRLLRESERNLRESSYLSDAVIVPHQVCGDTVDLVVIVRELWTLLPKLYFSRKGGSNKYGLTLEDENALGSGNTLFVEFIHDRERDTTAVGYRTKQFLGTRVALNLTYSDTTDGVNKELEVNRPFYSLDTPWALRAMINERVFTESLEAFNQDISKFKHYENEYLASAGYSKGLIDGHTQRYTFGFTRTEDLFKSLDTTTTLPEDRVLAYPWFQYSIIEDDFVIYQNLNALYRTEDVPVGIEFSALIGYADESFNSKLDQWVFHITYGDTPIKTRNHLIKSNLEMEGFWDRDIEDFVNTINTVELSYYWLMARKHRSFVKMAYDYGTNLTEDQLLTLGGEEGLRGYPSEYLLGEKRLLTNIEYRYFFNAHYLNLFRFAGVIFMDFGRTSFNDASLGKDSELLSSAGVGLRLNSSKTNISRIIHLDLAFPLNEKDELDEYQVRITSDSTF